VKNYSSGYFRFQKFFNKIFLILWDGLYTGDTVFPRVLNLSCACTPYNAQFEMLKGMLYPPGNTKLMCHKLPRIPREIFRKFGLNVVPFIILSCNQISTLKIDSMYNHAKFHQVRSTTWAVISILGMQKSWKQN